MATIRYVAMLSEDPTSLSQFYTRYLKLEELGTSAQGDVSLTDGFYNFTLFKSRPALKEPNMAIGLHHIGLQVESLDEVKKRYLAYNPHGVIVDERADVQHGTIRIFDPECNPISLSEGSFAVRETNRFPRLRHVAYNALAPDVILNFYCEIFGLRELGTSLERRQQKLGNRFAGDGYTNFAIHPFYDTKEGHESRFGVNHIGFLVTGLQNMMDALNETVSVKARPANRPYAEFRFRDPDGNRLDLSERKGWEVDIDKWERAA
jgi:catechol 2,3-dioxygenase-like lactoylglutathione lyase family enzyme